MKKILLMLLIATSVFAQSNLLKMEKPKYARGSAIDLDGSTEYMSKTSPTNLDLNGTERITATTDRGFETNIGNWIGGGNHSVAQSSTDKKTGTYSMAMTSSAAGDGTTNYASLPYANFTALGQDANSIYEKYTLELWARGTGIEGSPIYTSNFSVNVDGWTQNGVANVVAGNIDGIGGQDDVLRLTSDGANEAHGILRGSATSGVVYKLSYSYYLPSTNTTIKKLGAYWGGNIIGTFNVETDSWTTITINRTVSSSSQIRFYGITSTDQNVFVGTAGDVFYIKNVILTAIVLPSVTLAIGGQSKTIANVSCVPGTFTKLVWNFQATANEVNQPIKLYLNQADIVYIDDVSLTKAWDLLICSWVNFYSWNWGELFPVIVGRRETSGSLKRYNLFGRGLYNYLRASLTDGVTNVQSSASTKNVQNNDWHFATVIFNRIDNMSFSVDLETAINNSITSIGNMVTTVPLYIGYDPTSVFLGATVGGIMIVRFTDIAQSNVNTSTLTSAYRLGIPKTWIGGSPQVVAHYKFRGTTNAQMLNDISGTGNSLTGTNVSTLDKVSGSYPSR